MSVIAGEAQSKILVIFQSNTFGIFKNCGDQYSSINLRKDKTTRFCCINYANNGKVQRLFLLLPVSGKYLQFSSDLQDFLRIFTARIQKPLTL